MFEEYQNYYNKAITIKSALDLLKKQHESLIITKQEALNQMQGLIKEIDTYEKAVEYLKQIIEGLSRTQIEHLEALINSALSTIFYDQKYSVDLVITELRNTNNLQIIFNKEDENGVVVKSKITDNGFGVQSIIGFVLQVYFIIYHKLYPILFLDEAFSTLSLEYIPYLKSLINSLAEKYNFIFVLITHDTRFMEISDKTYKVKEGKVFLETLIGGVNEASKNTNIN